MDSPTTFGEKIKIRLENESPESKKTFLKEYFAIITRLAWESDIKENEINKIVFGIYNPLTDTRNEVLKQSFTNAYNTAKSNASNAYNTANTKASNALSSAKSWFKAGKTKKHKKNKRKTKRRY